MPDPIHMVLITGFVSTIVGVVVGVLVKGKIEAKYDGKFVTERQFEERLEAIMERVELRCQVERSKCPLVQLVSDVQHIKRTQDRRTEQLARKSAAEFKIWRTVLAKMEIDMDAQNRLLEGLA